MTWDEYYMNLAMSASLRSKDPSTKVGAVVVKDSTVAIGYNGFPIGIDDLADRWQRPAKYKFVVHSEANALSNAQFDVRGATLYVSHNPPCNECAKLIVQHGIARVVCGNLPTSPTTQAHSDESINMLREAGIIVDIIELDQIYNKVKMIMSKAHGLS
jgi:dCMP deaminase